MLFIRDRMRIPTLENVYQTLEKQHQILTKEKQKVNKIKAKLDVKDSTNKIKYSYSNTDNMYAEKNLTNHFEYQYTYCLLWFQKGAFTYRFGDIYDT